MWRVFIRFEYQIKTTKGQMLRICALRRVKVGKLNHWIWCGIGGISQIHRIRWKMPKIRDAKNPADQYLLILTNTSKKYWSGYESTVPPIQKYWYLEIRAGTAARRNLNSFEQNKSKWLIIEIKLQLVQSFHFWVELIFKASFCSNNFVVTWLSSFGQQ